MSTVCAFGQENVKKRIDSLYHLTQVSEELHAAYEDIATVLHAAPQEGAQELLNYVLAKDSSDLSKIYLYKGYSRNLSKSGNVDKSIIYKNKGLSLATKNKLYSATLEYHILLANAYHFKNILDSATYHINQAEKLIQNHNSFQDWSWQIHYNRALIQNSLNNLDKAAYHYKLMWEELDNSPNATAQNRGYALWVVTYFFVHTDKYPEDQTKFLNLLALHYEQKDPNVPVGHIDVRNLFTDEIKGQNIEKYKKLVAVSEGLNSINSYYYNTETLIKILNKEGKHKEAISYLEQLNSKIKSTDKIVYQIGIYKLYTESYIALKDYSEAFRFREKERQLNDSLITSNMRANVAQLEVSYETEKKERQIVEQKLTIERKEREQYQILLGSISLAGLLILALLFFRYKIRLQKKLAAQKEDLRIKEISSLKQHNKLLALNSMIEGQESERLRIAQDLHDSLGGLLSTVKSHFSIIQKEIQELEALHITSKTNDLIDEACTEVRRISHNMLPHSLTISGLQGVLEDIKEQLEIEGYKVTFEMDELQKSQDTTRDVMIYRLLQELSLIHI